MTQQAPFDPPAHGSTNWDTPVEAFLESLRTAHNGTDTNLAELVSGGTAVPDDDTPGLFYIQEVLS